MHLECRKDLVVGLQLLQESVYLLPLRLCNPIDSSIIQYAADFVKQIRLDFALHVHFLTVDALQCLGQHVAAETERSLYLFPFVLVEVVHYQSKAAPESGAFTKKPFSQFWKFFFWRCVGSSSRPLFAGSGSFFGV